jgi:2-hydroxy-6-oxonona-2,4-dienedioate hydrolase
MSSLLTKKMKPYLIDEGHGEPIVLLYGLFGSPKNFEKLVSSFRHSYRVIVPRLPFYESGIGVNIFSLTEFLDELVEDLQLEKIHLLGNSMGGHIALLYTLKHPGKLISLTLTGSSGLFENGMGESYPKVKDYNYIKTKTELTFHDPAVATKDLVDEVYETVNSRKLIYILSLAKSAIRNNLEKQLPSIDTPCCLIWGKNDTITPPAVAYEFKKLIPHSSLYWIENCGHAPMLECPEKFNTILHHFLKEVAVSKTYQ